MLRSAAVLVVAMGISLSGAGQRRSGEGVNVDPEAERQLRQTLTAYASGDDDAPRRWLETSRRVAFLGALEPVIRREAAAGWQRSWPLFVLEIAAAVAGEGRVTMIRVPDQLRLGQSLFDTRPALPGADAVDDRFELLWHQAAIAVAQGLEHYWLQQELIDVVLRRFGTDRFAEALRASRIPLARAIAAAGQCCADRMGPVSVMMIQSAAQRPVTPDQALLLFNEAAAIPALRAEALIRGAVLLGAIGRSDEALEWFARVPTHDDRALAYVQHLHRARLLDAADRDLDAVAAYRGALDAEPRSQVAATGLAASLLRSGRAADAAETAASARTMATDVVPHDLAFRRADARFVREWIAQLRRIRR